MSVIDIRKTAIISDCGLFRYEIRGEWDASLPPLVGCLNNPSKADAMTDDPTWIRGVSRAQRGGFGSIIYVNVGAGRATDPADWKKMRDPFGPENDAHIRRVFTECRERKGLAYGGWGAHGTFKDRHLRVKRIANEVGLVLHCLGKTKDGQPRHPLYIPNDQQFELWYRPTHCLADLTCACGACFADQERCLSRATLEEDLGAYLGPAGQNLAAINWNSA